MRDSSPKDISHFALHSYRAEGLQEGSLKYQVATFINSKVVETLIVCLVFFDIGLLSLEAGIDHHLFCINGRVMPKPSSTQTTRHGDVTTEPRTYPRHAISQHAFDAKRITSLRNRRSSSQLSSLYQTHSSAFFVQESTLQGRHHDNVDAIAHGHGHGQNDVLMCETREGPRAHAIAHRCHIMSITILLAFLLEILLKFWVDPAHFLGHWFMILDAAVVVVSLLVDTLVLWLVAQNSTRDTSSLNMIVVALLVVRMWRIVRIAHGLLGYAQKQTMETWMDDAHDAS